MEKKEKKYVNFMTIHLELDENSLGGKVTVSSGHKDAPEPEVTEFHEMEFALHFVRRFLKRIEQRYTQQKDQHNAIVDDITVQLLPLRAVVEAITGRKNEPPRPTDA